MSELLRYRQISFDSARIPRPDRPFRADFFNDAPHPAVDGSTRVTDFDEKRIVQWLMLMREARAIIFEELGVPANASYCPEVVRPFYAPGEGDIDLIIWSRPSPQRAIAIECKRVKVDILSEGRDRVNKLQNAAHGVRQANKLYKGPHAFFQTYLAVITEAECSQQRDINIPNRGIRSESTPPRGDTRTTTFKQLVEFPGRADLHPDVGILFIEIAQPSRMSTDTRASVRVCVYQQAKPRDQLDSVTNRVREIDRRGSLVAEGPP